MLPINPRTILGMALVPMISLIIGLAIAAPASAVKTVGGDIFGHVVWDTVGGRIYEVTSNVTVHDTLTIEPGVVVKFDLERLMIVQGLLIAEGGDHPDSTIYFSSILDDNTPPPYGDDTNGDGIATDPALDDWRGIRFDQADSNSRMVHCHLLYGPNNWSLLSCTSSSPTFEHCDLATSYYGITCSDASNPTISHTTVNDCSSVPIALTLDSYPVLDGATFGSSEDNGIDALGLLATNIYGEEVLEVRGTTIGEDPIPNITYYTIGTQTIREGGSLIIEPGVVVKTSYSMTPIKVYGTLITQGTEENPVVFTSIHDDNFGNPQDTNRNESETSPGSGNWDDIIFYDETDDALTVLNYTYVYYGGHDGGGITIVDASPAFNYCSISYAMVYGFKLVGASDPVLSHCLVSSCDSAPVGMSPYCNPDIDETNMADRNAFTALALYSQTLNHNVHLTQRSAFGFENITYLLPDDQHSPQLNVAANTTLTIDPGVVIKAQGHAINVHGDLMAIGTESDTGRITITSYADDSCGNPPDTNEDESATSAVPGNWRYLYFGDTVNDEISTLMNADIYFGGGAGGHANITLDNTSMAIDNCNISYAYRYGVRVTGSGAPTLTNCEIAGCGIAPIAMSLYTNPLIDGSNSAVNNGNLAIALFSQNVTQDVRLSKRDAFGFENITYMLPDDQHGPALTVIANTTLTIDPGVVIKAQDHWINIGGSLVASGTEMEPIIITSIHDDAWGNPSDTNVNGNGSSPVGGSWRGLSFQDTSDDETCLLEHTNVYYGGVASVDLCSASPVFRNCEISSGQYYGVELTGDSSPIFENCAFRDCARTPIAMRLSCDPSFTGAVFEDNTYRAIGIVGETLTRDYTWETRDLAQQARLPYVLLSDMTVGLNTTLTLEPGLIVKPLDRAVDFLVRGGLQAVGGAAPESLIVFTSNRDDFYGGDTNNNGDASSPGSGDWKSIVITSDANYLDVQFRHCVIRYGGHEDAGAVRIQNNHADFAYCEFFGNSTGIRYEGASGDSTYGRIEHCDFHENSGYAVNNEGQAFVVAAHQCWWGDPTGPLDDSDDTASGGWFSPEGLGDRVSDCVDYTGWTTNGLLNYPLGDVSLNGEVRAYDASLILQYLAEAYSLTERQLSVADVSCESGVSAWDASLIKQFAAELVSYFPCHADSIVTFLKYAAMPLLPPPDGKAGDFSVGLADFTIAGNELVAVPVAVGGSGNVYAYQMVLDYDPSILTPAAVRTVGAGRAAELAWSAENGRLRIAAASALPMPLDVLAEIEFRVSDEISSEYETLVECNRAMVNELDITAFVRAAVGRAEESLPTRFLLRSAAPNPFGDATALRYQIPGSQEAYTNLEIIDLTGRVVRTLVQEPRAPGVHAETWDGRDNGGRALPSGIYMVRLRTGSFSQAHKLLLQR